MKFDRTANITFLTENTDGELYTPNLTIGELIDDWNGDCNIVPANDAPVYKVRIDGKKLAPCRKCIGNYWVISETDTLGDVLKDRFRKFKDDLLNCRTPQGVCELKY